MDNHISDYQSSQTGGQRFRTLFGPGPILYSKLDRRKSQIRLVTILPDSDDGTAVQLLMETVSLDDKIDFEALSYCWGDPGIQEEIVVNNLPLKVTTNLQTALCAFRAHAGGKQPRLWIDAICIDQKDNVEKDWQVTLMGDIYNRASNVRTWLGSGDSSDSDWTTLAFHRLRKLTAPQVATLTNGYEMLQDVRSLVRLFQSPYWHRRWITQELVLARKLSMYCGSLVEHDVDLRALYSILTHLANLLQMKMPYHNDRELWNAFNSDRDAWKVHQPCHEILSAISPVTAFDKPLTKHPYLLRDIRGAQQKNDHDCVYGILGLLKRDLGHALVEPDYELPIEKVFEDFAFKLMAASKSLAFLYEAYPEDPRLPTWVCDLRVTSRDNNRFIPDEVPLDVEPDSGFLSATVRTGVRFPDASTQRRTNQLAQLDHLFDASAGSRFFAKLPATGVIHIHALFADSVADCSAHDKGLRDIHPTTLMEGWIPMDWMDNYTTSKRYARDPPLEAIEDEALLRTLCADCIQPTDSPSRRLTPEDAIEHRQRIGRLRDSHGQAVQHPTTHIDASMSLYKFFTTKDGRPGITFGDVQDGDMIVIAASLNMPIIVRGSRDASPEQRAAAASRQLLDPAYRGMSLTTFTLVGSCYVHGIMDGEAILDVMRYQGCGREDVFEDLFLI